MHSTHFLKHMLALALKPAACVVEKYGSRSRQLWAYTRLTAAVDNIDPTTVVLGTPELHGTGKISLGRNIYLYPDIYLETREQGQIALRNDVVISRGVHIVAHAGVTIGEGSMIGEYTSIRDANHRVGNGLPVRYSGHKAQPIHIGRNVWIGRGVCILPGVSIGDNAVIAANAVVKHNVAPNQVVGGVPARQLMRAPGIQREAAA